MKIYQRHTKLPDKGILVIRKYSWSIIWTVLILVLSLLPRSSFPDVRLSIPYLDKIIHFVLYFILLVLYSWESKKTAINDLIINALIGSLFLSFCTELGQKYIFAGRSFEMLDIVANIIGSMIGMLFFRILLKPFI